MELSTWSTERRIMSLLTDNNSNYDITVMMGIALILADFRVGG